MIVINFFGAPNSGKTATASGLFSELKKAGVEAEYVPELVRMAHYTNNQVLLGDELYLLSDKNHRLTAMKNAGIQVAVTDGPVLNSLVYRPESYFTHFDGLVKDVYESYENINMFIPGVRKFSSVGRGEVSSDEARARGEQVLAMLSEFGYHKLVPGNDVDLVRQSLDICLRMLGRPVQQSLRP